MKNKGFNKVIKNNRPILSNNLLTLLLLVTIYLINDFKPVICVFTSKERLNIKGIINDIGKKNTKIKENNSDADIINKHEHNSQGFKNSSMHDTIKTENSKRIISKLNRKVLDDTCSQDNCINGICNSNTCYCNYNYYGDNCEISIDQVRFDPVIIFLSFITVIFSSFLGYLLAKLIFNKINNPHNNYLPSSNNTTLTDNNNNLGFYKVEIQ